MEKRKKEKKKKRKKMVKGKRKRKKERKRKKVEKGVEAHPTAQPPPKHTHITHNSNSNTLYAIEHIMSCAFPILLLSVLFAIQ